MAHEAVVLDLMDLKGYQTVAAMITVSEIVDIQSPRQKTRALEPKL